MIVDQSERYLLSNIGEIDGGAVWIFETETGREHKIVVSHATALSLVDGGGRSFSVVHRYPHPASPEVSAHRFANPHEVISRIVIKNGTPTLEGDLSAWQDLPRAYVTYTALTSDDYPEPCLLLLDIPRQTAEIQRLDWYDKSYDPDWNGVIGVTQVPGKELLLFSIQRSSKPVLYDPVERRAIRKLQLTGSGGDPSLKFRRNAAELWAEGYDTLLRLDPHSWAVLDSLVLQEGHTPIGKFAFNRDESLCAVARPYTGDVVFVETKNFTVSHRIPTGSKPFEVALLADGRVFARDGQSGGVLEASL